MSELVAINEDLVRRLPLPLARLYRRARNAKTPLDRHQAAYYLWEANLKLLGCVAVVEYAELQRHDEPLAERLENLARPALGHWWEFVRSLTPVLAEAGDQPFAGIRDLLLGRNRGDLPDATAWYSALLELNDQRSRARSTVRLLELFERMIQYRAETIGHGAAGLRPADFYERLGRTMLAGMGEILERLDPLAGRRLIHVSDVRKLPDGNWLIERFELMGETPRRLESLEVPQLDASKLPSPEALYLLRAATDDRSPDDGLVPLHPLLIYSSDAQEVLFLNACRGRRKIEYLGYDSGDNRRREVVVPEQRKLLARVLGRSVDQAQLEAWAARSCAEEPPGEQRQGAEARTVGDGEFELLSRLGQGGMGIVFRAWQSSLSRQVALKCLLRMGDAKSRTRFDREMRALGRVDHPNLVKIYATGRDGEQWYYAMELIEGADLGTVCEQLADQDAGSVSGEVWQRALTTACERSRTREEPLSGDRHADRAETPDAVTDDSAASGSAALPDEASQAARPPSRGPRQSVEVAADDGHIAHVVRIVRQTASAAHALHEAGVIHRDIKPGNIMLSRDGAHVVLMDLGLAQLADESEGRLTRTRQFVGTLRYASPEQVMAVSNLDARSDVYSLGATLWELLTLRPLYGATEQMPTPELMVAIQERDPESPRKHNPRIPPDLAAIVMKSLSRERSRRYATAAELEQDLARWQRGEPVTAQPPTLAYVVGKYARRHRAGLAVALLLLVAAFAGTVASFQLIQHQRDAAIRSEQNAIEAKDDANRAKDEAVLEKDRAEAATRQAEAARNEAEVAKGKIEELVDFNRIGLAYGAIQANDYAGAAWHLEECSPGSRGWEWRYCQQLVHPELATFPAHNEAVTRLTYSPDGRLIASASSDGSVRLLESSTGRLHRELEKHPARVTALTFSPTGSRLALGAANGNVIVWNVERGELIHRTDKQSEPVSSLAFSPDGSEIIVTGNTAKDSELEIRNASTGATRVKKTLPETTLFDAKFAPAGDFIATAGTDGVSFWDAAELNMLKIAVGETIEYSAKGVTIEPRFSGHAIAIDFHPFGPWLVSGWEDGLVRMHYTEPWRRRNHDLRDESLATGSRGVWLESVWTDATWPSDDEQRLFRFVARSAVVRVSFSADGQKIVAVSDEGAAALLRLSNEVDWFSTRRSTIQIPGNWQWCEAIPVLPVTDLASAARDVALSPVDGLLATGNRDGSVKILHPFHTEQWNLGVQGQHFAFSPDGGRKLALANEKTRLVLDVATGEIDLELESSGQGWRAECVAFSSDGTMVAFGEAGGDQGCIRIYRTRDGTLANEYPVKAPIRKIAVSHRDALLAALDFHGAVHLLHQEDPGAAASVFDLSEHGPVDLCLGPDGSVFATAGTDQTVRLWESSSGRNLATFRGHSGPVHGVRFGTDGAWLVSYGGNERNEVIVWDIESQSEQLRLPRLRDGIEGFDISPDGQRIVTASGQWVRLWDASTGFPIIALQSRASKVATIRYSLDGEMLVLADADGVVTCWEALALPGEAARIAHRVEELFSEHVLAQNVAEAIRSQEDWNEQEENFALRMLRGRFETPQELQQQLWSIASDSTAEIPACRHLIRMGSVCAQRWPETPEFALAVAAAEMRQGEYESCLRALGSLDATHRDSRDAKLLAAIANWKMGRINEVIETLESVQDGKSDLDAELRQLLNVQVCLESEVCADEHPSSVIVRSRLKTPSAVLRKRLQVDLIVNSVKQQNAMDSQVDQATTEFVWEVPSQEHHFLRAKAVARIGGFRAAEADGFLRNTARQAPRMHFLGLAANEYTAPEIRSLTSPLPDLLAVQAAMKFSGYESGEQWSLVDEAMTHSKILTMLEQVYEGLATADDEDLLIVFYSGHAIFSGGNGRSVARSTESSPSEEDQGQFLIIPSDFDPREAEVTRFAISWEQLRRLGELPCRTLFVLDACHSGDAVKQEERREVVLDNNEAAFAIIAACRPNEIAASTRSGPLSVLTSFIARGLLGEADIDLDGMVDSKELYRFVQEHVPMLMKDEFPGRSQNPTFYESPKWRELWIPLTVVQSSDAKPEVKPPVEIELLR
jgi:eukaryotic-like serine/threonine-protein kinase